jgi:predicted amidohydrolase YtcJ
MDLCFFNGNFINPLDFNETIDMICINDGRIDYKGDISKKKLSRCKNAIDLQGNTLLPGFNDSHLHLLELGKHLYQCDLSHCSSIDEVIQTAKDYCQDKTFDNNNWLIGNGWDQELFDEQRMLTTDDLDQISTDYPIVFKRTDLHVLTTNTKGLALIEAYKNQTIAGGSIDFDQGILKENAMGLLLNQLPAPQPDELKEYILLGANHCRKNGITSVHSDDLSAYPNEFNDLIFKTYFNLENQLPLRVFEQSLFRTLDNLKRHLALDYQMDFSTNKFRRGPLKILLDGSLGSETAYLEQPYENSENRGIKMYDQNTLDALVKTAIAHNIDVAIHGIGDGAINMAIDAIAKFQKANNRNSIIHCQVTTDTIFQQLKDHQITANVQPIFLDKDIHFVEDRIGLDRANTSYAFHTMDQMGIPVAFSSDAPVDSVNPLKGIHLAVNRRDLQGSPQKPWFPKEQVSVEKALFFYTYQGAFLERQEQHKGALELGMVADFVILDQNPLTVAKEHLKDIQVVNTYLNGKNFID